jgi:hypothetical protein
MVEVKLSGLLKVSIIEYERGWGQRVAPNDTCLFSTLEEAEHYAKHSEEGGNPDYYFRARITKK